MIDTYIKNNYDEMKKILRDLCLIPAPSHHEEKRAEYCKKWFESIGAEGVYIDSAKNVVFPLNCDGSNEITVFVAHTDTVFPDREPMPYYDDGEKIHCPGVADDTTSVVVLLMMLVVSLSIPLIISPSVVILPWTNNVYFLVRIELFILSAI